MKNGKLNDRERASLQRACDILNKWCDWENIEREKAGFNPVLDDIECSAASAAGLIRDFLYDTED